MASISLKSKKEEKEEIDGPNEFGIQIDGIGEV